MSVCPSVYFSISPSSHLCVDDCMRCRVCSCAVLFLSVTVKPSMSLFYGYKEIISLHLMTKPVRLRNIFSFLFLESQSGSLYVT